MVQEEQPAPPVRMAILLLHVCRGDLRFRLPAHQHAAICQHLPEV